MHEVATVAPRPTARPFTSTNRKSCSDRILSPATVARGRRLVKFPSAPGDLVRAPASGGGDSRATRAVGRNPAVLWHVVGSRARIDAGHVEHGDRNGSRAF